MHWRFPFMVFCAYNMVQPASADQAVPNSVVTLSSPVIRVADLFANAGPEADRVLGNSPAPGNKIVVGATQLAAIAAAYRVPWQPDGSDTEVVLASPGSAMPATLIDTAIANAVANAGGPQNAAITLPDFTPPMIPPGAPPSISVTRINYDPQSNTFSTSLVILAAGMAPQNLDLSGLAVASVQAVVASHDLAPGKVLNPSDVTLARLPENQAAGAVALPSDAMGMALNSGLQAGAALLSNNLVAPIVVRKGAFVVLNLSAPGMVLTAQGIALGAGGAGSLIAVLNPASHAVVQAVITGPGSASIAPGSSPVSVAQNSSGYTGGYTGGSSYAQAHGAGYAAGSQAMTVQP